MMRGGFPGMGKGNMGNMMKQVKKMQKEMEKMEKDLDETIIEASAGGGVVTAKVNGKKELIEIKIDKDILDPEDVDMVEDLVLAAVNEAMRQAEEKTAAQMQKLTGGMNIPGL